ATATVGGGTEAYSYVWSNGETTAAISGLTAGIYSVVVTDANGCEITDEVEVTEPDALTIEMTATELACYGDDNGMATATVGGGTLDYTYSWSNGETTATISDLIAGMYTVIVTDANGCMITDSIEVVQPTELELTINSTNVLCFEESNGTADASVSGGTEDYSYLWSNGATTAVIEDLAAGVYTIVVTDENGCEIVDSVEITEPGHLHVYATATGILCYGDETGTATATVGGGTEDYTYSWTQGGVVVSTENPAIGLAAGSVIITVTDANGCTAIATTTVEGPEAPLSVEMSNDNLACYGDDDATASASVEGGTAPYTYLWSNGETTMTITDLAVGIYTVVVTDANDCEITGSVEVEGPEALTLELTSENITCNGYEDGSATAIVGGGTLDYSYLWSNGETTATISGLTAGMYSVTITDANGCTITESVEITEPEVLAIDLVSTFDATCGGEGHDGSAEVTVTGGTAPYSYLWSNGATTASVTDLDFGTYSVDVTDANGCMVSEGTVIIGRPVCCDVTDPGLIAEDQESCGPFDPAMLTSVTPASGGIGPVEYLWIQSNVLVPVVPGEPYWTPALGANTDATYDPGMLTETTYFLRCTRNEGCPAFSSESNVVIITIHPEPVLATTVVDVLCYGDANGTITATVTEGTAPFTYLWSDGQTTATATDLAPGEYSVTVTDANGCSDIAYAEVMEPSPLTIEMSATDVDCYGNATGTATTYVGGGTGAYTYVWSNGETTMSIEGLIAGMYTVEVTDVNGCMITDSVEVTEPDALTIEMTATAVDCYGNATGSATTTVGGGTAPYTYLWSNGGTTATISDLTAGMYTVVATDENGCEITDSVEVTEPDALTIEMAATAVDCYGNATGSATATIGGGTEAYSYVWSNGGTTATISDLIAGMYTVVVTDANGCEITDSVEVTEPDALTIEITATELACYGDDNASATATVGGGTAPFDYLWSNGETTATISGLTAGIYSVVVTDANGCEITDEVEITEPDALTIEMTATELACYGDDNGMATATVGGGTLDYTYSWSNGETTATISDLTAGMYTVVVTDANGCMITDSIEVVQPTELELDFETTMVLCNLGADGSATVSVTGGTPEYSYLWNTGATTATISDLTAGIYTVTITDANGCEIVDSVEITEPGHLHVFAMKTDVICYGTATGTGTAYAGGGTPDYTYEWKQGGVVVSTENPATNLVAGGAIVKVTDANGCTAIASIYINGPEAFELSINSINNNCYGDEDGEAAVSVTGGEPGYTYLWSNGETTETITGLAAGTYSVVVTDNEGCTIEGEVVITEPEMLTIEMTSTNVSCYDGDNGSATATVGGGTA
ncbi:SprB repeat-containing protein, partial [Crocinitomix catalasitica]|uniref:SprB repeat-containing protein n=1 Tax=Crocinitomix catalasitica TaxID=184607 RepID=UPI0005602C81